jgi:FAD/FMN-containing dehydrogenase
VLPDGSVAEFGSRAGYSAGYDLVGVIVGSEGTLGVVTQVTVRLESIPESVETLLASFPDVVSACHAVAGIIEAGLTPAALEIMDRRTIAALEASVYAAGLPSEAGAVLLIELDGAAVSLGPQVDLVRAISIREGAAPVQVAKDEEERQRFWKARKGAFGAMGRLAPDLYVHDAVVPRNKLPEVLEEICAIGDRHGLMLSNVFHAGDGNLHPNISFDRRDPDVLDRVIAAGVEILECCVKAGGVITGEHGVGNEKREYMHLVFSEADIDAMKRLRDCFNPDGLCNPGKIFPTTRFCVESNPKTRGYDRVPFD